MPNTAPIALFVYNRPVHTLRTIEALRANMGASESDLFVFSDGPATEEAATGVAEVRRHLGAVKGFRRVEVVERPRNFGLAASIIDGVTRLCGERGRVIVVEDDILTSRWFLQYLNEALELYADDEAVASVHGYLAPWAHDTGGNFFLYGADCWGWATWQRVWKGFVADGTQLVQRLEANPRRRFFDYIGPFPHTHMLKGYIAGRNNSWAVRWHASMLLAGKLTLHPGRTLVNNIGLDGSGTHCSDNDSMMNAPLVDAPVPVTRIPTEHSVPRWKQFRNNYFRQLWRGLVRRILPAKSR